jgi:rhodanese-related sulfurtransferase
MSLSDLIHRHCGDDTVKDMSQPQPALLDPEITPQAFAQLRSAAQSGAQSESHSGAARGDSAEAPILLDVREPWEFQLAHLPDSLPMPMGDVTSRAHAELDPDAHIVVLCHHGQRSLSVAMWLRAPGIRARSRWPAASTPGREAIDPTVPRY